MTQVSNVIAFPAASAAGRTSAADKSTDASHKVLEFVALPPETTGNAAPNEEPLTAGNVWLALNEGRFEVHYQPQYDIRTGDTVSAEALVRLVDTDGSLIYPDRFIDMVERCDLIIPLGRAVIERVCADLAAWRADGFHFQRVAINVSARQLNKDVGLVEFVEDMLVRYGLRYSDLEFELTERQHFEPECTGLATINTLAGRGARFAMDDFGNGYSSIMHLTDLPVTAFKLDRALVSRLPDNASARSVVASLLDLARRLGLDVVAEGIETLAQEECLATLGCPYAQGFGFAKPMREEDVRSFLESSGEISPTDERARWHVVE